MAPPRFLAFLLALLLGVGALRAGGQDWALSFVLGFDLAALLFLLLAAPLLGVRDIGQLRRHAEDNDANRPVLLMVTAVAMLAILLALVQLLPSAASATDKLLIIATLALAWLFSNSIYALHYAHLYYRKDRDGEGGLGFAGERPPDYGDFVYFAFTLGMTFQTSDTSVKTAEFRRAVTLHSLAAFVFNLGVVAFTINVLGSR
ncbi:DUF1345 domain-containing protein [Sandaracinobacter sp. RS1-74]|uniref:DUF1345 domain-containing protein n=1 Tax=Sandaracinobacteroides sayramensis TaxID=2913411 RepID=UPI001EDAF7C8|nr:DUF1345 domain-containing protein [Sandaracinobacteroides sayramensis]